MLLLYLQIHLHISVTGPFEEAKGLVLLNLCLSET